MDEDEPGLAAWQAETTPCERIRAVTAAIPHPESVRDVAETTGVEETVAGECLEDLVDEGVLVRRVSDEDEEMLYEPNEFYTVQDLAAEHSHEDLVDRERELEVKIESWRDEYRVDGPDELRDQTETTTGLEEKREQMRVVSDWKLCINRLSFVRDAVQQSRHDE